MTFLYLVGELVVRFMLAEPAPVESVLVGLARPVDRAQPPRHVAGLRARPARAAGAGRAGTFAKGVGVVG